MNMIVVMATVWYLAATPAFLQSQSAKEKNPAVPIHDMRLCPIQERHTHMNERGAVGMGFSQSATAHHFLIQANGGAIQVAAKDLHDEASRDSIRHHLKHIAHAFASADFDIPMFVHDTTPPGVPEMKNLRGKISYTFAETPGGGQVLIRTSDPQALAAIHKFLKFQIEDHQTGDSVVAPTDK